MEGSEVDREEHQEAGVEEGAGADSAIAEVEAEEDVDAAHQEGQVDGEAVEHQEVVEAAVVQEAAQRLL